MKEWALEKSICVQFFTHSRVNYGFNIFFLHTSPAALLCKRLGACEPMNALASDVQLKSLFIQFLLQSIVSRCLQNPTAARKKKINFNRKKP